VVCVPDFQTVLDVACDLPFVRRPNPRGQEDHDPDERIADVQYRDALEFVVGHGASVRATVTDATCRGPRTQAINI